MDQELKLQIQQQAACICVYRRKDHSIYIITAGGQRYETLAIYLSITPKQPTNTQTYKT